jgi:hypothetical protein
MKPYLIIFALMLAGTAAKAQTSFKTNESISGQLRNGTAPGLVYSKAQPVKKEPTTAPVLTESAGQRVGNTAVPGGISDNKTTKTKAQSDLSGQKKSTVPLASDKPAERFAPVEKAVPPKIVQ